METHVRCGGHLVSPPPHAPAMGPACLLVFGCSLFPAWGWWDGGPFSVVGAAPFFLVVFCPGMPPPGRKSEGACLCRDRLGAGMLLLLDICFS